MWTKPFTTLYCIIIVISPLIFHYYVIPNFNCKFLNSSDPSCREFNNESNRIIAIVNIAFGLLALLLIFIGVALAPKLYNQTTQSKMEKRLIFQSIFSSTFLVLLYTMAYFSWVFENLDFLVISHFMYLAQFYPPIFILFLISPVIREEFAKYYGLKFLLKKHSQIFVSSRNFGTMHLK